MTVALERIADALEEIAATKRTASPVAGVDLGTIARAILRQAGVRG